MVIVLIALLAQAAGFPTQRNWDAAERDIKRLEPAAFPDLPAGVRADLGRRQCTIPQPDGVDAPGPYNVIRGRFTSQRSTDIAVLCSKGGVSAILVYRDGSRKEDRKSTCLNSSHSQISYAVFCLKKKKKKKKKSKKNNNKQA